MIRVVLLLAAFCALAAPMVRAQQTEAPLIEVQFDETEAIPGQPLSLRLTVLVPTWMTSPVVFPGFEVPNLMVRLPERATTPVSRRVGGDTWSGVSRHYRLIPMIPGGFRIAPQQVVVTWSDPDSAVPRQDVVMTPEIAFSGTVPPGAEGLDPFIAATALSLTQDLSGAQAPLKPGDSVTRVITAQVAGVSPMFLPPLIPDTDVQGVAQYPAEPVLVETGQRGAMAGTRTESVTYIAQSGGAGAADDIRLDWFNLDTGRIETATAEGIDLRVDAPVAAAMSDTDRRLVALLSGGALIVLGLLLFALRRIAPQMRARRARRQELYLASEAWAYRQLGRVISDQDYAAMLPALDRWAARATSPDPRTDPAVAAAVSALGAARYGPAPTDDGAAWRQLHDALHGLRDRRSGSHRAAEALPPLNPMGPH
ncbi:hypothetical protein LCL97_19625 [Seohaeicola saemankumensis]|nr:hypothetical protein [Seohaeicola saemankumensis]MCA0873046.1 hypothetical protein [Seohaeicola saemankumensis]